MATKAPAKKTTRKAAPKKAEPKDINQQIIDIVEAEKNAKSCAYPGCSQRADKTFGKNEVPGCDAHASVFETQAEDGAGIQQLMESYRG